nr:MAG TPA_asm: hypothetical protein [Caudoviricetes sp.]
MGGRVCPSRFSPLSGNRDVGDLAGERGHRVEGDGDVHSDLHVPRLRGVHLNGDGRSRRVADGHRLSAARGHHVDVGVGEQRLGRSVLRAGDDHILHRHQAHRHELAEIAAAGVVRAEQRCDGGIHVHVRRAGHIRRQHLGERHHASGRKQVGNARCVQRRHLVGRLHPVLGVERVVQVRGDQGNVALGDVHRLIPHAHGLGVHAGGDVRKEVSEVHVVADELNPLCRDPAALGLRVQCVIAAVEAVARHAARSAPARILEYRDVVAADADHVRLTEVDLHGIGKQADGLGVDRRKDGAQDLHIDPLLHAIERLVSVEASSVALEILPALRGVLAGLRTGDLRRVQHVVALELVVELLVARVGGHALHRSAASVHCGEHLVSALDRVLKKEGAAGRDDVFAFVVAVDFEIVLRHAVESQFSHFLFTPSLLFRLAACGDAHLAGSQIVIAEACGRALGELAAAAQLEIDRTGLGGRRRGGSQKAVRNGEERVLADGGGEVSFTKAIDVLIVKHDLGEGAVASGGDAETQRFSADSVELSVLSGKALHLVGVGGIHRRVHVGRSTGSVHIPCILVLNAGESGTRELLTSHAQQTCRAVRIRAGGLIASRDVAKLVELVVRDTGFKCSFSDIRHSCSLLPLVALRGRLDAPLFKQTCNALALLSAVQSFADEAGLLCVCAPFVCRHHRSAAYGEHCVSHQFLADPVAILVETVGVNARLHIGRDGGERILADLVLAVAVEGVQRLGYGSLCGIHAALVLRLLHGRELVVYAFQLRAQRLDVDLLIADGCAGVLADVAHIHALFVLRVEVEGCRQVARLDAACHDFPVVFTVENIGESRAGLVDQANAQAVFAQRHDLVALELRSELFRCFLVHASFHSFFGVLFGLRLSVVQRCRPQFQRFEFFLHGLERRNARARDRRGNVIPQNRDADARPLGKYRVAVFLILLFYQGLRRHVHAPCPHDLVHQLLGVERVEFSLRHDPCMTIPFHKGKVLRVVGKRSDDSLRRSIGKTVVFFSRAGVDALGHIVPVADLWPDVSAQDGLPHKCQVIPLEIAVVPLVPVPSVAHQPQLNAELIRAELLHYAQLSGIFHSIRRSFSCSEWHFLFPLVLKQRPHPVVIAGGAAVSRVEHLPCVQEHLVAFAVLHLKVLECPAQRVKPLLVRNAHAFLERRLDAVKHSDDLFKNVIKIYRPRPVFLRRRILLHQMPLVQNISDHVEALRLFVRQRVDRIR